VFSVASHLTPVKTILSQRDEGLGTNFVERCISFPYTQDGFAVKRTLHCNNLLPLTKFAARKLFALETVHAVTSIKKGNRAKRV
jgi:hypothetical protein